MKKVCIVILMVFLMAAGISSCNNSGPFSAGDDDVDYYGCPNSNRVKKLNLKKSRKRL